MPTDLEEEEDDIFKNALPFPPLLAVSRLNKWAPDDIKGEVAVFTQLGKGPAVTLDPRLTIEECNSLRDLLHDTASVEELLGLPGKDSPA